MLAPESKRNVAPQQGTGVALAFPPLTLSPMTPRHFVPGAGGEKGQQRAQLGKVTIEEGRRQGLPRRNKQKVLSLDLPFPSHHQKMSQGDPASSVRP